MALIIYCIVTPLVANLTDDDGTIPQFEPPHWELFNTFPTNIQIENGVVCDPPIE